MCVLSLRTGSAFGQSPARARPGAFCTPALLDSEVEALCVYSHGSQRDSSMKSHDLTAQRKFQAADLMCSSLAS